MSPSSSWANSVIPMEAVVPSTKTHSCSFEYFNPSGHSITYLLTLPTIERQRSNFRWYPSAANFYLNGIVKLSLFDGDVSDCNRFPEGGRPRAARHATNRFSILEQGILAARDARLQEL